MSSNGGPSSFALSCPAPLSSDSSGVAVQPQDLPLFGALRELREGFALFAPYRQQRKVSTFYFNPLHTGEFDLVIDPAGAEPVVQCTLFLKVQCRIEP